MLARLKWATHDAMKQWKSCDSSIVTDEMRVIFIRRARWRLIAAYRKLRQLYPTHHASKLAMPRLKQLRTEDIRSMISEYKHFITAANMLDEVPSPITEAVVASILQSRLSGLKLPRAHTNNL